jgi:hypothetical protein
MHQITVPAEYAPTGDSLFPIQARTLSERIGVRRSTANARVEAAVQVIAGELSEPWLVWANLNSEADLIEKLLPDCQQVAGRHDPEVKVSRLLGFKKSQPRILVTKPKVAGHGMNYQHCARMVFIGLTDSFEAIYQCVRRCWRFGQPREVHAYFIASELEGAVVQNLKRKEIAFDDMLNAMSGHMRDLMREQVIGGRVASEDYNPTVPMILPEWLTGE